jgi:hypothetical protein
VIALPGAGSSGAGADLVSPLLRFGLDLAFAAAVIWIYNRLYRHREYVFTYFVFNVITFFLCLVLREASHFGLALALFGVFGILRYRTEQIRIRDLTYLFVVIGLAVLNAVAGGVSLVKLLAIDGVILAIAAALELGPSRTAETSTDLLYDRLELLRPGNEDRLRADIHEKTGLTVVRIEVRRVDLLRDAAEITLFHRPGR